MRRVSVWLYAAVLVLIALGLRVWNMKMESPSYGEVSASLAALKSPLSYLQSKQEQCTPVFYLLLHPMVWFGGSMALMRLVSVIGGTVAVLLVYLLGRLCFAPRAAAVGALVLAIHPLHIFFSQEATFGAVFTLLLVVTFLFLIRSGETPTFVNWLVYDACGIAILYLHPQGLFVLGSLLVVHLLKIFLFRDPDEQRRPRRLRLFFTIVYNYIIIAAAGFPWLSIIPPRSPWDDIRPEPREIFRVYYRYSTVGMLPKISLGTYAAAATLLLLLVPPFIRTIRKLNYRTAAAIILLGLLPALPFGYSMAAHPRFIAPREALVVAPLFAWLVGLLLARCNVYVRVVLLLGFCGLFGYCTFRQARTEQGLSWNRMSEVIATNAKNRDLLDTPPRERTNPADALTSTARNRDLLVYWPDFTTQMGEYYFGNSYEISSASQFFENRVVPPDQVVFFVISQVPKPDARLYSFPGALRQYSRSEILYQDKLSFVIRTRDRRKQDLQNWWDKPQSLRVADLPSTDTQFNFTPVDADSVFQTDQFHWQDQDISYELDGRRVIWTAVEDAELRLPVTLAPGTYLLRVHCSPKFEQPEYGKERSRKVSVTVRTGEEKRKQTVEKETTIKVTFSVEAEMKMLPVHISASPLYESKLPRPRKFGLKIFSIAIDQVNNP